MTFLNVFARLKSGGESDDSDDAEDKENGEGNPIERKYLDKIRDATLKG